MGVIYEISNSMDDRVYIGSTLDFNRRNREHINDLKQNKHPNIHLQRFCNKYGINLLEFRIVEECDDDIILEREQLFLDNKENLFNISVDASAPMTGRNHSEKTKEHFSKIRMGINNPMYGTKRPKHVIDAMQSNRWKNVTKKEQVIRKINRKIREELIINKNGDQFRCMSQSHAAHIIGVSHQSIQKSVKSGKLKCKGWTLTPCEDIKYNEEFVLNNIDLFDDDCFPQPELIAMIKSL